MYILNTTFTVRKESISSWLKYAQTQYIPNASDDGLCNPLIMRICNNIDEEYENYAIQFTSHDKALIEAWIEHEFQEYSNDLRTMFGEGVLSFNTILETI